MEITKADIAEIPLAWADQLAEWCDPEWACRYEDSYAAIRASWPENKAEVAEMIYQLTDNEENHSV